MKGNDGCFEDQLQTDRTLFHTSDPSEHWCGRGAVIRITVSGYNPEVHIITPEGDFVLSLHEFA